MSRVGCWGSNARERAGDPKAAGRRGGLGDDATMFAGCLGVRRNRARWGEVEIALDGQAQRPAEFRELSEAHVAELRLPEAEIAQSEGQLG